MKLRQNQKVVSINQDTGEILEGVIVYFGIKYNPYGKGWIMTSQEALEILASDEDLSKDAYKVLIFLMSQLNFENWVQITQREIAEKIKIDKSNVSKAISLLLKKEILIKGQKIGRSYELRLNPYFAWKGKVKSLKQYRKEKEKEEFLNKSKNKVEKIRNKKIEIFSKKHNIPIEEIKKLLI